MMDPPSTSICRSGSIDVSGGGSHSMDFREWSAPKPSGVSIIQDVGSNWWRSMCASNWRRGEGRMRNRTRFSRNEPNLEVAPPPISQNEPNLEVAPPPISQNEPNTANACNQTAQSADPASLAECHPSYGWTEERAWEEMRRSGLSTPFPTNGAQLPFFWNFLTADVAETWEGRRPESALGAFRKSESRGIR